MRSRNSTLIELIERQIRLVEVELKVANRKAAFWIEAEEKARLNTELPEGEPKYNYIRALKQHKKRALADVSYYEKEMQKLKGRLLLS